MLAESSNMTVSVVGQAYRQKLP